jgi:hypothetical protein
MIVRAPHLLDDVLYECYFAEHRGEPMNPPAAEHLTDCDACSRRYADVGAFLTQLSDDADADVHALFPAERLRQQQQDIARRLELVGRAARVISFPGRLNVAAALPKVRRSTTSLTTRWVAAAAAAGLFVGVAAGTAFNFVPGFSFANPTRHTATVATRTVTPSLPSRLSSAPVPAAEIVDTDDRFMSDLESALDRPHTSELAVFDALTPHVREIRDFSR